MRFAKQIIVLLLFFGVIFGVAYGAFRYFTPAPTPTPTPGPIAKAIQVLSQKLIKIDDGDYDFVARVLNPNTDIGSGEARYILRVFDAQNKIISEQNNSFYILPGQAKYIVLSPLRIAGAVRAEIEINQVRWEKIDQPSIQYVDVVVRSNTQFQRSSVPASFGSVAGSILNNSDLDLNRVDVAVVVKDTSGDIVAAGKTQIDTFLSKTTRGFEITWFNFFNGQPDRVDVEATTNVFAEDNFIRRFGTQEQFQQLY